MDILFKKYFGTRKMTHDIRQVVENDGRKLEKWGSKAANPVIHGEKIEKARLNGVVPVQRYLYTVPQCWKGCVLKLEQTHLSYTCSSK